MNNVRTVSDTKRAFYTLHTRPINSIYRRVVEELMVEMHLLAVNMDYRYDPIYALGVVTSFERFMQGYRPEADKPSIFDGLCKALQDDPNLYRQDAEQMRAFASQKSAKDLVAWFEQAAATPYGDDLQERIKAIANNPKFKYSRLFAIGLFSLFELADPSAMNNEAQREELLKQVCAVLHLPQDKVQKDLELYRSNLEKMTQAQAVMSDILQAEKKKREERSQANTSTDPAESSDTPKDEAASGS
ncbi:photosystem II biogenesis protein Psp29 [Leptodesmis sichuanensis A121]|nr:photosystem II biogenesis protein Psp29 [Leptodesmis sichuanensis]UIE40399.1 photosystem II biogenesis protein Psp29 [Leptodesmis sichuanensis A121]